MSKPIAYVCWYHRPRTEARLGSIFSSAFLWRFKLKNEKRLLIIVPKMCKLCSLSLVVFNSVEIGVWLYIYIYIPWSCFLFWSTSIKIWCEIYVFLHHSLLFFSLTLCLGNLQLRLLISQSAGLALARMWFHSFNTPQSFHSASKWPCCFVNRREVNAAFRLNPVGVSKWFLCF